jgi:catechol 2,3-dioxygenase-like lactoylglutathione lyase family enzyme
MDGTDMTAKGVHGIDFANLRHVGVVVSDLDEAMADLTAVAGFGWEPVGEQSVRYVKSSPPAPHLELVEARDGTLWDSTWLGVQHLSIWVPDLSAAADHLEHLGALRVTGPPERRPTSGSVYYRLRSGMLLEISTLTHP